MPSADSTLDKGLPVNLDAERFVLGAILLDESLFIQVSGLIEPDDFSLEKHRRIFRRMSELQERGERIDRVTLAEELMKQGQLESVDGITYLMSLDDGLPRTSNIDSYVRIVREKSQLRRIIFASQRLIDRCMIGDDAADSILAGAEEALLKLSDAGSRSALSTPRQIIESYEGGINAFLDPANRIKGVGTGFIKFDEMTGGMRPGELLILAARPAMGKTAMALNIAQHLVLSDPPKPVAVFSLEMSGESLLTRMICAAARVNQHKFRAGFLNERERRELIRAANQMAAAPLYIDDTASINLMDMHAKLRRLRAERGVGLVIVDYLQLMTSRGRHENRVQEVSALSRGLKLLSKEIGAPIMALSQLSRAPEMRDDKKPQLSDLRESGSIEQDADLVAFIFRPEVYQQNRADLRGKAELIIAKQRNGPTGVAEMIFIKDYTKFENAAGDVGEEPPPAHDDE
ncbi:MAG TPA: replicative DNA helicase [Bryobacteraceae bacterium]|nr:replicative DNA helicase [Bryobacteraceae bacterium]